MLRWLSLALVLATSHVVSAETSLESKLLDQCRARAWVRAPDMVPGDIIAGDVKVKLIGPCANAENYVLGLRYKERIFWKLRHQDVPLPKAPEFNNIHVDLNRDLFQLHTPNWNPVYNATQWKAYKETFENKDLWTVHEEERIAFEIKTTLVSAESAYSLPSSFISQFGILVPNTNYPQGLDYRQSGMMYSMMRLIESIYEYFVEIKFSNGTTSETPAGITTFTPYYHLAESRAPPVNLSLARTRMCPGSDLAQVDMLQSNYTIELSFPDGPQVYQNSLVNLMAIIHRTGYTNRTDIPVELCAMRGGNQGPTEWRSHELKGRTSSSTRVLHPLVLPSRTPPVIHRQHSRPCKNIDFATPVDLTGEGHISSTSSEPISLSLHVGNGVVLDFPTYYQKLTNLVMLNLAIKPDPLEPKDGCERMPWNDETADMDESDYDWVPWTSGHMRTSGPMKTSGPMHMTRVSYHGNTGVSVVPMQKQGHLRPTPVHYLSEEARHPVFVAPSDIADLRLMSPEERDLIVPLAQPYTKVFAKGEELRNRYFARSGNVDQVIYVGETWANKVVGKGQRKMDDMEHSLVVQ